MPRRPSTRPARRGRRTYFWPAPQRQSRKRIRSPTAISPRRSTRLRHCRNCSPDWGHDEMTATTGIGSFADVPLHGEHRAEPATEAAVDEHVASAAAAHGHTTDQLGWGTAEGIDVKPVYIEADRDAAVAAGYPLDTFPGEPPLVRGP